MEKRALIQCTEGHQAFILCSTQECKAPAPVCNETNCRSHKKHQDCFNSIQAEILINRLTAKGKSAMPDDSILRFYDITLKSLTRDREEYLKSKPKDLINLQDDEQKLYHYLKEGAFDSFFPELVFKVCKNLKNTPIIKQDNTVRDSLKVNIQKVEILLGQVKQMWNSNSTKSEIQQISQNTSLRFSDKLCYPSISITQNGRIVKRFGPTNQRVHGVVCIQPALSMNSITTLYLKIIQRQTSVGFGICSKKFVDSGFKLQDSNSWIGKGVYAVWTNGIMKSHSNDKSQDQKKTNFSASNKDNITIQFNPFTSIVSIMRNLNENIQQITVAKDSDNLLYACLLLWYKDTEIELIKMSCRSK